MCLKITIETKNNKEMSRIWITCPTCKRRDWFYSLYIGRCDFCGASIDNIRSIYTNLDARLYFHSNGV